MDILSCHAFLLQQFFNAFTTPFSKPEAAPTLKRIVALEALPVLHVVHFESAMQTTFAIPKCICRVGV
jgi:hypothetical protein